MLLEDASTEMGAVESVVVNASLAAVAVSGNLTVNATATLPALTESTVTRYSSTPAEFATVVMNSVRKFVLNEGSLNC
jgi:hypothetical protein